MAEGKLKEVRPDLEEALPEEEALPDENIYGQNLNETGRQTSGNLPIQVEPEAKKIIPNMSE